MLDEMIGGSKIDAATVPAVDLVALLEVADGYIAENGAEAVARYAVPEDVERAIMNAKAAIRRAQASAAD